MVSLVHMITMVHMRSGMSEISVMNEMVNHKHYHPSDIAVGIAMYQVALKHKDKERIFDILDSYPIIPQTMLVDMDKGMRHLGNMLADLQDILFPHLWADLLGEQVNE